MVATKKGDVILSWVLLVGFVIGLAVIVTMWVKDRATDTTRQTIDKQEQEIRCAQTSITGKLDCTTSPQLLTVANKGSFTIQALKIRQDTPVDETITIKPGETQTLNSNIDTTRAVDIIPSIQIDEKEVPCATRKITLTC